MYPTSDEARAVNKFLRHKHEIDAKSDWPRKKMGPEKSENRALLDVENVNTNIIDATIIKKELETALPTVSEIVSNDFATTPAPVNLPLADGKKTAMSRTRQEILDQLSKIVKVPYRGFNDNPDKINGVRTTEQQKTAPATPPPSESGEDMKISEGQRDIKAKEKKLAETIETILTPGTNITISAEKLTEEIKATLTNVITTEQVKLPDAEIQTEKKIFDEVKKINTIKIQESQIKIEPKKEKSESHKKIAPFLLKLSLSLIIIGTLATITDKYVGDKFRKRPIKPDKKPNEQTSPGLPTSLETPNLQEYVPPITDAPSMTLETVSPIIEPLAEPLSRPDTVSKFDINAREIPEVGAPGSDEFIKALIKQAKPSISQPDSKTEFPNHLTNQGTNNNPTPKK